MIRRDIQFGAGPKQWLIVSQVEHARLSGELARHCSVSLSQDLDPALLQPLQQEVWQTIDHHDDGWLEWDACPGIDPDHGRPFSFREMPLEESLPLWSRSIDRTARIGPLAAWAVSSHFSALLEGSTREHDDTLEQEWLQMMQAHREYWMAEWQKLNPELHTAGLAEQALLHLQVFDVLSLWLSLYTSLEDEVRDEPTDPYRLGEGTALEMELNVSEGSSPAEREVRVEPWLFDEPRIEVKATGMVVPIQIYRDGGEVLESADEIKLCWNMVES